MPKPVYRSPPKSGWQFVRLFDACSFDPAAPEYRCEAPSCNRKLRWVHVLEHPDWDEQINVGCCCAAKLSSTYDAAGVELKAKKAHDALTRFLNPDRWRESAKGNQTREVRGTRVTIYLATCGYNYVFDGKHGHGRYSSEAEAMTAAFHKLKETRSEGD